MEALLNVLVERARAKPMESFLYLTPTLAPKHPVQHLNYKPSYVATLFKIHAEGTGAMRLLSFTFTLVQYLLRRQPSCLHTCSGRTPSK